MLICVLINLINFTNLLIYFWQQSTFFSKSFLHKKFLSKSIYFHIFNQNVIFPFKERWFYSLTFARKYNIATFHQRESEQILNALLPDNQQTAAV